MAARMVATFPQLSNPAHLVLKVAAFEKQWPQADLRPSSFKWHTSLGRGQQEEVTSALALCLAWIHLENL